jgi:hypothetical protein
MSVELVQIAFDHTNGPPETRALHIRQDGATPAPPNVAAYPLAPTKGEQLTIEVTLRFPDTGGDGLASGAAVRVRAQTTEASADVLGNVQQRDVTVPGAASRQGTFLFDLSAPKLHAKGVGKYTVAWEWQFQLADTSPWVTFHTSSATIYITLDVPSSPWTQEIDATSQRRWPWTRMLDHACDWATGVKLTGAKPAAVKKIAKKIENAIYTLGDDGKFDYLSSGEGRYVVGTSAGIFNVTTFLDDLEGPEEGLGIYCTECAVAVAAAANCLGGDLALLRVDRIGSIHLNSYILIGKSTANEGNFNFHDIAVRPGSTTRQVFDATLRPDWDVHVGNTTHDYRLTQGKRLGKVEVKPTGTAYLQRLLEHDVAAQWKDLKLCDVTMPCLDQCDGPPPPEPCTDGQWVSYALSIESAAPAQPQQFPQPDFILAPAIEGFRAVRRIEAPARLAALAPLISSSVEFEYVAAPSGHSVPRQRRRAAKLDSRRFKMAVSWSPTPKAAQQAMAWLMTRTTAPIPPFSKEKIGDVSRASARGSVMYMVRGNVVAQIASTGKTLAPTEVIARTVDKAILSGWSGPPAADTGQRPPPAEQRPSGKPRAD